MTHSRTLAHNVTAHVLRREYFEGLTASSDCIWKHNLAWCAYRTYCDRFLSWMTDFAPSWSRYLWMLWAMHNVQICPRLTLCLVQDFSSPLFSHCVHVLMRLPAHPSLSYLNSSLSFSVLPHSLCVFSQCGWLELVCLWVGLFAYWGLFSPLVLKDLFTETHYDASSLQCWMRNGLFALWTLMILIL